LPGGKRFGKSRWFQRCLYRRQRGVRQGAYRASNYMVDSLLSLLGQAKSVL
jgi:hypothetical protein